MSSPAPPSHFRDHSTDYYYFIAAVAVIALLLVASNIVVVSCCSRCALIRTIKRLLRSWRLLPGTDKDDADDDHISQLIPARKYKKEQAAAADSDCSVCLMPFAEGEEVRQLPECKHSFHAPCIDMWLYSHSNCPMCRASVLPQGQRCPRAAATDEETSQSRRSLIEAAA